MIRPVYAGAGCKFAPVNTHSGVRTLLDSITDSDAVGDGGYRRIRADIIFGRLRPDQKLRLEAMKDDYGVSVSTLREILSRLSSEGFVVAEGRRGFEVAPVSAANLKELADLRILLECHAMQQSFVSGDMEWEGRIVSAHHKLAAVEQRMNSGKSELALWKRYDGEFHQALISNCGSRALIEAHQMVFDKYFRYPMISADRRGAEPIKQHRQLLECALARDAKKAKAVLVAHVNNCVEYALASGALL
ncbi:MAG TPA: FCD domain-containing protein [Pseudolabrys sp.]|nr:FCD domain-containing protein [Pseudolabrys sp.]